jgi:hypothetical protein
MIDKNIWKRIAENWSKDDDGIAVPDDKKKEADKAKGIEDEDLVLFDDISNDEINDILADLGLDDID